MIENERFGLIFAKTGSINSYTVSETRTASFYLRIYLGTQNFTVLLIGPLGGSEATRLQEDVEATHVLVVAIATSQEIGKFLTYITQLFGQILQLVALTVPVVAIATSQEFFVIFFQLFGQY
jgi:hypothetical protein